MSTVTPKFDVVVTGTVVSATLTAHISSSDLSLVPVPSGVARGGGGLGGSNLPIRTEAVFFTAVKSLLLNIITSL